MGNKTPKWYPKIAKKGNAFAKQEYETDGYEREWLAKGYYHGYIAGVKALRMRLWKELRINAQGDEDIILGCPKQLKIC